MSATDPLRRGNGNRGGMRAVEPAEPAVRTDGGRPPLEITRCSYRPPDADFYCWKYGVWYNLMDCCYRHQRQTYDGCADCGQGRGNLRQNIGRYTLTQRRGGRLARP